MRRRISAALAALALAAGLGATAAPASASTAASPTAIKANTWVSGSLRSSAETDWYAFTTTGRSYVAAVLGDLPANYNLSLYDSTGRRLAFADHAGTRFESIDRFLAAGTYRLRVGSSSGSSSRSYALVARVVAAPRIAALTTFLHNGREVVGEFVNASEQWAVIGNATATFYASDGRRLGAYTGELYGWYRLPPHGRVPYSLPLGANAPAGTSRVAITPQVSFVPARTPARLTTTVTARSRFVSVGIVRVNTTATVRNDSTRSVRVAFRDQAFSRRGVLTALAFYDPRVLAPGASATFSGQLIGFAPTTMSTMVLSARSLEETNVIP